MPKDVWWYCTWCGKRNYWLRLICKWCGASRD